MSIVNPFTPPSGYIATQEGSGQQQPSVTPFGTHLKGTSNSTAALQSVCNIDCTLTYSTVAYATSFAAAGYKEPVALTPNTNPPLGIRKSYVPQTLLLRCESIVSQCLKAGDIGSYGQNGSAFKEQVIPLWLSLKNTRVIAPREVPLPPLFYILNSQFFSTARQPILYQGAINQLLVLADDSNNNECKMQGITLRAEYTKIEAIQSALVVMKDIGETADSVYYFISDDGCKVTILPPEGFEGLLRPEPAKPSTANSYAYILRRDTVYTPFNPPHIEPLRAPYADHPALAALHNNIQLQNQTAH